MRPKCQPQVAQFGKCGAQLASTASPQPVRLVVRVSPPPNVYVFVVKSLHCDSTLFCSSAQVKYRLLCAQQPPHLYLDSGDKATAPELSAGAKPGCVAVLDPPSRLLPAKPHV